jgi:futalosine hydrolase
VWAAILRLCGFRCTLAELRILVVTATAMEIAPVAAALRASSRHEVDLVTTGVGMVATAARCSRALARTPYDLALNFGVCGSFDPKLTPGAVVHVVADRLPEMGAEDGETFLTIQQLKLLDDDAFPFHDGELVNAAPPANAVLSGLPAVRGITVNTVHGAERSIAEVTRRFHPQVESMEGAAFMYACLIADVPFAQVRAVSNVVERRNRESWRVAEAIENLGNTARAILENL